MDAVEGAGPLEFLAGVNIYIFLTEQTVNNLWFF